MATVIEIPGLTLHGDHIDHHGKQIRLKDIDSVDTEKQRNLSYLMISLIGLIGGVIAALQWANTSNTIFGVIALILLGAAVICFLLWRLVRRTVLVIRARRRVVARVRVSADDAERFIHQYALLPR